MRWLAAVGVLLVAAFLAARVDMASDLSRLLAPGAQREAFSALRTFGGEDALIIEVSDVEDLDAAVVDIAERLAAVPGVTNIRDGLSTRDALAVSERIAPHAAAFIAADVLAERLSDDGMRDALRHQLDRLSGPGGGGAQTQIRRDPLNLESLALSSLRGPSTGVTLTRGRFTDASGERALVFAHSEDVDIHALSATLDASDATVRWYGGARVASETEAAVRADVRVASIIGALLLIAVLVLGFRSVRAVFGAAVMATFAGAGIAIGAAIAGPIHPLQLGFAAALLGVAVDYWVHLVCTTNGRTGTEALRRIGPGLVVSIASTALAFGVLALSDEPVVRVLGLTGAGAVLLAGAAVAWLGPSLVGQSAAVTARPVRIRPIAAVVVVAVLAALLPFVASAPFDGDPRSLLATSPELVRDQRHLQQQYGLTGDRGVALVRGETPDIVRSRAAQVEHALDGLALGTTAGPDRLVPSLATQSTRRAVLPADLQARIDAAAKDVGFTGFPGAAEHIEDALSRPVPADLWAGTPLADRLSAHLSDDGMTALVSMPSLPAFAMPALADTARTVDGVTWLEPAAIAEDSLVHTKNAMFRGALFAGALLFLGLWLRHRSVARAALALFPAVAAAVAAAGVLGLTGTPLNVVGLAVGVLVLGLSVDYGVFTVEALGSEHQADSRRAIALSAATSLAGMAPLLMAHSPALRVAGIVLVAGVCAALATSRWVVPALASGWPSVRVRLWIRRAVWAVWLLFIVDVWWMLANSFATPNVDVPADLTVVRSGAETRVGGSVLRREQGLWVLRTDGTAAAVGAQSAVLTVSLRDRLEDELYDSFSRAIPNPAFRWLIIRGAAGLARGLPSTLRDDDLTEIAAAATVLPDRYWLQGSMFTRKVHYHAIHDMGQALVDTPLMGCTAFAAGGSATIDGHWILARNFDFDGGVAFDRDKVVRVHTGPDSIPYLSVAFAGMVGAVSGVNADGIAVSINASATEAPPRLGTPMTLIVRELLQTTSSLDEVEAVLRARTGFVAENVLVVDADAGEAALFEVSPDRVVRVPVDETVSVSNHFRDPSWDDDAVNAQRKVTLTTIPRLQRMQERVSDAAGSIDLDVAQDILTDRMGPHGLQLPRGHRWALDADIATHGFIVDATTRTVRVSRFPHLSAGFITFELDRMLAGDLTGTVIGSGDSAESLRVHEGRDLVRAARRGPSSLAEDRLIRAIVRMPGHPEPLIAMADWLVANARADEARPLLEQALAAPPEYAVDIERITELMGSVP